jgi:hypothetical protein
MKTPKKPIVQERHFAKYEQAWGQCYQEIGFIEIDPRQSSKQYFGTLLHELLHFYFPNLSEKKVAQLEGEMTKIFWAKGFRRIQR